jgi:hypothetical protein
MNDNENPDNERGNASYIEYEGMVGIYWLLKDLSGILLASTNSLSSGQHYGGWIIGLDDHYAFWEQKMSTKEYSWLSRRYRDDYSMLPRGRVSFNTITKKYVVYHGNWFCKEHIKLLKEYFHLEMYETVFEEDEHYYI